MIKNMDPDEDEFYCSLFKLHDENNDKKLNEDQLIDIFNTVNDGYLSLQQMSASVLEVCGNKLCTSPESLKLVLQEMERRQNLMEDIEWEFKLLDEIKDGAISITNARCLFEIVHGDNFDEDTWSKFFENRPIKDAEVFLSEIEVLLCDPNMSSSYQRRTNIEADLIDSSTNRKETNECTNDNLQTEEKSKVEELNETVESFEQLSKETRDIIEATNISSDLIKCTKALQEAVSSREIKKLVSAISLAINFGFDQNELTTETIEACKLLEQLRRLERLRMEVLELKQSTISELRSYNNPLKMIHTVMIATYLLLGTPENETRKWTTVQTMLGKIGKDSLKRRISEFKVVDVEKKAAKRAKYLLDDVDLEVIRDVSKGAATFFVWVEGIVADLCGN